MIVGIQHLSYFLILFFISFVQLIDAVDGNYMIVRGVPTEVLNLSSFDFLGFSQDETVRIAARSALEKYGCGSCGPRGFYGTIDQHLKIEEAMALFMGTEEAISYSDGAATVSSTIPAFVKKGDLVLCDEACCEPIRMGLKLSRGTVQYFKHNDMEDLESLMQQVADDDIKSRKRNAEGMQRRFVIVEGLYRNTGDLCPLPEIVALKERYCYRLVLDESLSFGTMGGTGRGKSTPSLISFFLSNRNIPIPYVFLTIRGDRALWCEYQTCRYHQGSYGYCFGLRRWIMCRYQRSGRSSTFIWCRILFFCISTSFSFRLCLCCIDKIGTPSKSAPNVDEKCTNIVFSTF